MSPRAAGPGSEPESPTPLRSPLSGAPRPPPDPLPEHEPVPESETRPTRACSVCHNCTLRCTGSASPARGPSGRPQTRQRRGRTARDRVGQPRPPPSRQRPPPSRRRRRRPGPRRRAVVAPWSHRTVHPPGAPSAYPSQGTRGSGPVEGRGARLPAWSSAPLPPAPHPRRARRLGATSSSTSSTASGTSSSSTRRWPAVSIPPAVRPSAPGCSVVRVPTIQGARHQERFSPGGVIPAPSTPTEPLRLNRSGGWMVGLHSPGGAVEPLHPSRPETRPGNANAPG
mgnify:CR=1 FL=1